MDKTLKKIWGNLAVNLEYAFSNVYSCIFEYNKMYRENESYIKIVVHGPNTILKYV